MKRQQRGRRKYYLYETYPIFWKVCKTCHSEVRRESMWKVCPSVSSWAPYRGIRESVEHRHLPPFYLCKDCHPEYMNADSWLSERFIYDA